MKHIAFTGTSRAPLPRPQRKALRAELLLSVDAPGHQVGVHLGDAIHGDATCHQIAAEANLEAGWGVIGHRPFVLFGHPPLEDGARAHLKYDREEPAAEYLERDHAMVDASERLLACPRLYKEERRSGTWATIRYALKKDVRVTIIWPDGSISDGNDWYLSRGGIATVIRAIKLNRIKQYKEN